MNTGVIEDYINLLHEDAQPYKDKILNGHCKSFDEYRYDTGILVGLAMAERTLHDTLKLASKLQEIDEA
ncbi:MAG: hypothetical protein DRQ47_01065 [Gammaproteobacteria bacterium]|nr:MAG: hypothetical protein DRQ35_06265 [Gammaproteobacteria bacterium]RLA05474.1 MAG: hypothetical protein DRQ47_01065 [Gammaproteobacteria bacterium]